MTGGGYALDVHARGEPVRHPWGLADEPAAVDAARELLAADDAIDYITVVDLGLGTAARVVER